MQAGDKRSPYASRRQVKTLCKQETREAPMQAGDKRSPPFVKAIISLCPLRLCEELRQSWYTASFSPELVGVMERWQDEGGAVIGGDDMEAGETEASFVVFASPDLAFGSFGEAGAVGAEVKCGEYFGAGDGDISGYESAARSWWHWAAPGWCGCQRLRKVYMYTPVPTMDANTTVRQM